MVAATPPATMPTRYVIAVPRRFITTLLTIGVSIPFEIRIVLACES
jgi:hypothetical protein